MIEENDKTVIAKPTMSIYGVFGGYSFRNEQTGVSVFRIYTRQKFVVDEQYERETIKRNRYTNEDEIWRCVICNATKTYTSYFRTNTPVKITGYFQDSSFRGKTWEFAITDMQEASNEETTTIQYLASPAFDTNYEQATKIVAEFGADIFSFVKRENAISLLVGQIGLVRESAEALVKIVSSTTEERRLYTHLAPLHIPYPYCVKAVKMFGNIATECLLKRPYYFGHQIGLSFAQCDAIGELVKALPACKDRVKLACVEATRNISNAGHIYSTLRDYSYSLNRVYRSGYIDAYIPLSTALGCMTGSLTQERLFGFESVYANKLLDAEKSIAKNVLRISRVQSNEPYDSKLIDYAEEACNMNYGTQQKDAFSQILRKRGFKILTGGPGTGKTTTIKGILLAYQRMHPDHIIKLCAPTGRAAQRMAESTEMPATTMHRLLEYRPYGVDVVHKDESNPIEADLIVVDEVSMTDVEIFSIFLSAVKNGTTVILVGDIHQLESVGPGAVLHDLLRVDDKIIQKCMLTEVFRQKGGSPIIENAQRINEGRTDLVTCDDFKIINTKNEEESMETIQTLMQELYNPDDPFETQILCPARNGLSGIENCNVVLQNLLNPNRHRFIYGRTTFRINDKILMVRNNPAADYYNGDVGVILDIVDEGLVVNIRDNEILLTRDMLEDIKLAYGMTIHKSQGSEFKNVIVVMPMQPSNMLVRNLFYTGVTRAKKRVIIINEGSAMTTAIRTDRSGDRRTLLKEYLPTK